MGTTGIESNYVAMMYKIRRELVKLPLYQYVLTSTITHSYNILYKEKPSIEDIAPHDQCLPWKIKFILLFIPILDHLILELTCSLPPCI